LEFSVNHNDNPCLVYPAEPQIRTALGIFQALFLEQWRPYRFKKTLRDRGERIRFGGLLRLVREEYKAQGARNDIRRKRGEKLEGFKVWLTESGGPPYTTAVDWIKDYEIHQGLRNVKPKQPTVELAEAEPAPTLSDAIRDVRKDLQRLRRPPTSYDFVSSSGAMIAPAPAAEPETESDTTEETTLCTAKFRYSQEERAELRHLTRLLSPELGTDNESDTILVGFRKLALLLGVAELTFDNAEEEPTCAN
jgi:hypothetical protein